VLGEPMRSGRTSGAASGGFARIGLRVEEGLITTLSPFPGAGSTGWLIGICLLGALVYTAVNATRPAARRLAVTGAVITVMIYLLRLADGLGFVPGLVAATPLAAVGLALGWARPASRFVVAAAVLPLPLVVAFQFVGGASPQWAGRYLLFSGFLLATVGLAERRRMERWAQVGVIGLSVAVTVFGFAWLVDRSHAIADAGRALDARSEPVLISANGFVPREFGATYGARRWLAAGNDEDLEVAVDVVEQAGDDEFGIVDLDVGADPRRFDGWSVVGDEVIPLLNDARLRIVTYERS
jgi:hypothetical protein